MRPFLFLAAAAALYGAAPEDDAAADLRLERGRLSLSLGDAGSAKTACGEAFDYYLGKAPATRGAHGETQMRKARGGLGGAADPDFSSVYGVLSRVRARNRTEATAALTKIAANPGNRSEIRQQAQAFL